MKTFTALLGAIALLPLTPLLTPSTAMAQTNPPIEFAHEGIMNKLDRIRLDQLKFDKLPLREVINVLIEMSKRGDPDHKGINFLVNPNPAPSPTGEQVDPSSVTVTIDPALKDVRLWPALDAIVLCADQPIHYSIEDYGVMFGAGARARAPRDETFFSFPGGHPEYFLQAIKRQCRVDWLSIASIPPEMESVQIPKLRINHASLGPILSENEHGGGSAAAPGSEGPWPEPVLKALVALYNNLGDKKPELGHLIVEGSLIRPAAVLFVGGGSRAADQVNVRAFPIGSIPEKEWVKLRQQIDMAQYAPAHVSGPQGRGGALLGRASINQDTHLLIATGSQSFLDMVQSVVSAFNANDALPWGNPANPRPEKPANK